MQQFPELFGPQFPNIVKSKSRVPLPTFLACFALVFFMNCNCKSDMTIGYYWDIDFCEPRKCGVICRDTDPKQLQAAFFSRMV